MLITRGARFLVAILLGSRLLATLTLGPLAVLAASSFLPSIPGSALAEELVDGMLLILAKHLLMTITALLWRGEGKIDQRCANANVF